MDKESSNHSHNGNGTSPRLHGERTKNMTLKLTLEELRLLISLASDQLFRRQFIDPKMPGHKHNPDELSLGKALVARLRLMVDEDAKKKANSTTG